MEFIRIFHSTVRHIFSRIMEFEVTINQKGGRKLCYHGFSYTVKSTRSTRIRWECSKRKAFCCHGAVTTDLQVQFLVHLSLHKLFKMLRVYLTLWLPNKIFRNCHLVPNKFFRFSSLVPNRIFGFSLLVPDKIWPSTFPPTTDRMILFSE